MKAKWDFEIAPTAERDLERLPRDRQVSIIGKIVSLCADPHSSAQVKKLKGSPDRFRLRAGEYRIVYTMQTEARKIRVEFVRRRKDAYRGL